MTCVLEVLDDLPLGIVAVVPLQQFLESESLVVAGVNFSARRHCSARSMIHVAVQMSGGVRAKHNHMSC